MRQAMREPVVASFGMGTNSAAMLIKMVQDRELIDAVLASDTGGERPETYAFCEEFSRWLVSNSYPAVTVVRHLLRDGHPAVDSLRFQEMFWKVQARTPGQVGQPLAYGACGLEIPG